MSSGLSRHTLVESDRGRCRDLDSVTSLTTTSDLGGAFSLDSSSSIRVMWSGRECIRDIAMSFAETTLSVEQELPVDICREMMGFTLGGVGSNPANGSYSNMQ